LTPPTITDTLHGKESHRMPKKAPKEESFDSELVIDCQLTTPEPDPVVSCFCRKCRQRLLVYIKQTYDQKNLAVDEAGFTKLELEKKAAWRKHKCLPIPN
jgi:hypothetical protein